MFQISDRLGAGFSFWGFGYLDACYAASQNLSKKKFSLITVERKVFHVKLKIKVTNAFFNLV